MIHFSEEDNSMPKIVVLGIGGAGGLVVDSIARSGFGNIETAFIDTNSDFMNKIYSREKFHIQRNLLKRIEAKTKQTKENVLGEVERYIESLSEGTMVFLVSGLGGRTGASISPYISSLLREHNQWVWALVTIPFFFEGKQKIIHSLKCMKSIQKNVDACMIIPHDKIFKMIDKNISMQEVFSPANEICIKTVRSICSLTNPENWISLNFSDIKDGIQKGKTTAFGFGQAHGKDRIYRAVEQAISSPLLGKQTIDVSNKLLVSIYAGTDLNIEEIDSGIEFLNKQVPQHININFGVETAKSISDKVEVRIMAMGLDRNTGEDISADWGVSLDPTRAEKTEQSRLTPRAQSRIKIGASSINKAKQTTLDLQSTYKGKFERSTPTLYNGEDLDVPTFLRRKHMQ